MAAVTVVGGGFAGLSSAARLAKLGHDVRLIEQDERLGGRLRSTHVAGFAFDDGTSTLTLPAAVRDLFRKSGRPLERVLDLGYLSPGRRHVFTDRTVLDLPNGSRADQTVAIDRALGGGPAWTRWLDDLEPAWEVLRRRPDAWGGGRRGLGRSERAALKPGRSLSRESRSRFQDPRLRALATDGVRVEARAHARTPAYLGVTHLLERSFGRWAVAGGSDALADALERRLEERRVEVVLGSTVEEVMVSGDRVRGVVVDGTLAPADVVVWAAPAPAHGLATSGAPRGVSVQRLRLGLGPSAPSVPAETIVHCDPPLRISRSLTHDGPGQAWTVRHHGDGDPLLKLAEHGVDVRPHVSVRDEAAAASAATWQLDPRRLPDGLFAADRDDRVGLGLELTAMRTATIADTIGKA